MSEIRNQRDAAVIPNGARSSVNDSALACQAESRDLLVGASDRPGFSRRAFLQLIAATGAGTLAACSSQPARKLIPYVVPAEETVPGVSTWYKSTCRECPAGCGVLVRTREARALKLEGNPDHPVNRGKLCVRGQAALQGLYNPDRIQQPLRRNARGQLEPVSWAEAEQQLANLLGYLRRERQAHRVVFVTERVTGSLDKFFREWLAAYGTREYYQYEPFAYEALREANRRSFGTSEIPRYDIARARMLLSFGADFLETWVSNVAFTREFAEFRSDFRRRFVAFGPRRSLTAANADEWIPVKPGSELTLVLALIGEIVRSGLARAPAPAMPAGQRESAESAAEKTGVPAERLRAIAREFARARPSLALGGGVPASDENGTALEMAVNLLNTVCGNVGETIRFGQGTDYGSVATYQDMLRLTEAMKNEFPLVVCFRHANPAFTLPAAADFRQALAKVPFKVSFSSYLDETTAACDLVLPDLTPLERWEDYEPRAGVYGLAQPVMPPVFQTKHTADVLLAVGPKVAPELERGFQFPDNREYLRNEWRALHRRFAPQQEFDSFWQNAVENGGVWSEPAVRPVRHTGVLPPAREASRVQETAPAPHFDLVVYPSLQLFDGRGANRPWLQEIPEAMSKIVWNAWVEIHPATAAREQLQEGDVVGVFAAPRNNPLALPVHLTDGVHPDVVAIPLGQGHSDYGRYAENKGTSPMALLPAEAERSSGGRLWAGARVWLGKQEVGRKLVKTQTHDRQEGRGFARVIPLAELTSGMAKREEVKLPILYPPHEHKDYRWGMAIDLNQCVGCNACIAACYAENNIPVVGEHEVDRGHHMAWIRVERYYEPTAPGQPDEARFVPMLCQHCDNAPCESVCPVYATYHNPEGLNVQVYNRCVGTRYCSNNCPYKVRRFNWFDWEWPAPLDLQLNPDLSVRTKGVMEKCTFCVQRLRAAKDAAKDDGRRKVRDGEVTPACVQTCPADAIVFGNLDDPESRVSKMAQDPRGYHILGEINTKPAITYLARVKRIEES
jgi:molybdopterin-containing oxidoreductase family iron-sulfur binding subunit